MRLPPPKPRGPSALRGQSHGLNISDEAYGQLIRSLNAVVLMVALFNLGALWLSGAGAASLAAPAVVITGVCTIHWLLLRHGPQRAMCLLIVLIWLALAATATAFAGLRTDLTILFPFLIAAAGWTLGRHWLIGITLASLALFIALGLGELTGVYVPAPRAPVIESLAAVISGLVISGLIAWQSLRSHNESIEHANSLATAIRAQEQSLHTILDNMPGGIAQYDDNQRITFCNRHYAMLFGRRPDEMIGRHVSELVPAELYTEINTRSTRILLGEPVRYQRRHTLPVTGETRDLDIVLTPLVGGATFSVLIQVIDITEKEQMQAQLRELNANLEERVAERGRELEEAMNILQRAKSDLLESDAKAALGVMVASITHEINTPIANSLIAAGSLTHAANQFIKSLEQGQLRRSEINNFVESLKIGTDIIERNLVRSSELISNFKQLAVDQTSEQRRPFDLADVVREVLVTLQPQHKNLPHKVITAIAPGITMDSYPGPLGQVLINLINNAYLHAFEGRTRGSLHIEAKAAGQQVQIVVSDDGAGMSKEVLDHLFQPFFSTKIGQGGSGLGMSIVEDIVCKRLGGSIAVESEPGQGTRYRIELPATAPAPT